MGRKPSANAALKGVKWDWRDWSNLVWGVWIFVIFMALELTGYFRIVPWRTLSETVWVDGDRWPVIYFLVAAFLCGLTLHFLSKIPLLTACVIGVVVAVIAHFLSGWPKW